MLLDEFDYKVPEGRIALQPMEPREKAKLLYYDGTRIQDYLFGEFIRILPEKSLLVFNDTRVIPASLLGFKGTVKINVNLIKKLNTNTWQVLLRPAKRLKLGDRIIFAPDFHADLISKSNLIALHFNLNGEKLDKQIQKSGIVPLPPYIKREVTDDDIDNYQTVYAKNAGAVAAPTAGLHFSKQMMHKLQQQNIAHVFVTLHVGAGTFLPVKTDNINEHQMHAEYGYISQDSANIINQYRKEKFNIVSIGTTALRLLESASDTNGYVSAFADETSIFIKPGYKFKVVDYLFTNFHLPKSTLLMLVSAFVGMQETQRIYQHAIKNEYRLFSYGDCSLLCCKNKI